MWLENVSFVKSKSSAIVGVHSQKWNIWKSLFFYHFHKISLKAVSKKAGFRVEGASIGYRSPQRFMFLKGTPKLCGLCGELLLSGCGFPEAFL